MATTEGKSVFVDTNVLVYANNRDSNLCEAARATLENLTRSGSSLFISDQILREYLVIMTRPGIIEKPISLGSATEDAIRMMKEFTLLFPNQNSLDNLMEPILKHELKGKRIHDAAIVSLMLANGIAEIVTNNIEDFKSFHEITIHSI